MAPSALARRSIGPVCRPHVPAGRGFNQPGHHATFTHFCTMDIRCPRSYSDALSPGMVLAFMQSTTRSCHAAGSPSTFLCMAQPVIILLRRGLFALLADGSQSTPTEEQAQQEDDDAPAAYAVRHREVNSREHSQDG